ncbi:hypothetical protein [Terribacillus saccharophilus]|nr:hypothetical protein [Terribacillus saccharophilus]
MQKHTEKGHKLNAPFLFILGLNATIEAIRNAFSEQADLVNNFSQLIY